MRRSFAVLATAAMVLAVMCGAAFADANAVEGNINASALGSSNGLKANDWGTFVSPYFGFYVRSKLFGGKTTPESYTNSGVTGEWDFETETGEDVKSISQTIKFNADTKVIRSPEGGEPIQVKAGETRTFNRTVGSGSGYYTAFELYNDYTDVEADQTAISKAPFQVKVDDVTISGQVGVMHSVREMVDSKCVPTIEPVGEDAITAIKWAFVRSPDFTLPVKRSAENDVAFLRRFEFRALNDARYPRYRCWVNKTFKDGKELSGTLAIADVEILEVRENAQSPWKRVTGWKSIPLSLSSGEIRIQYAYSDGGSTIQNDRGDQPMDTQTWHIWRFTDETLAPEVPVKQESVTPSYTDPAINDVECTGTNADVPDDLDGATIAPSEPGETNKLSSVIATVTIKVDYDPAAIGSSSEIDVEITGDFSRFAGKLSSLFALIKNNVDGKYHKFPILSANTAGLTFKLPVKGFFSEKVITIAEVEASSETKQGSSSGACSAGAGIFAVFAALAAIRRRSR